jgi:two-component system phosphate regulon sensor histidine kinase PhoR
VVDVQNALDKSIEQYYAEIAKSDVITYTDLKEIDTDIDLMKAVSSDSSRFLASFFNRFSKSALSKEEIGALDKDKILKTDSLKISNIIINKGFSTADFMADQINGIAMFKGRRAADSLDQIKELTNKIIISITRDTLDFNQLTKFLSEQLARIGFEAEYALTHYKSDSVIGGFNNVKTKSYPLKIEANATFIPRNEHITMFFKNSRLAVLKKGFISIAISFLYITIIATVLLYLYRIIKTQKELSEIKNDLITNITHEFKTPIATISTAVEGIRNFNKENDPIKTDRYLNISNQQLVKLNLMVEKLLETATLNSDKLILKKEAIQMEELITQSINKFAEAGNTKSIIFRPQHVIKPIEADPFHLENAISNLIDNAIKYGGDQVSIYIKQHEKLTIIIEDNGGNISKEQKEKVFDKFYRIPKGNVHDVKGFGIGLYYTKNIIEKHNGNIELEVKEGKTSFKITL